jgi:hypothetical protein
VQNDKDCSQFSTYFERDNSIGIRKGGLLGCAEDSRTDYNQARDCPRLASAE